MTAERLIAIETSSRHGSAAVAVGPRLLAAEEFAADLSHGVELLPCIARLCEAAGWRPADLQIVAVSIGPGSFTGLRVAVTTARHLALATGARIVAVPSLAVLAENARRLPDPPRNLAVILDAKRRQVYVAGFARVAGGYVPRGPAVVADPAEWLAGQPRPLAVMGEGVMYHRAAVDAANVTVLDERTWIPRAADVHRLGWAAAQSGAFVPPRDLVPLYIRRPEAEELWEKRRPGAER